MKKAYVLREYTMRDFQDSRIFLQHALCYLCGHHLPVDQTMVVDGVLVHDDIRICVALTKKSDQRSKKPWKDVNDTSG